MSVVPVSVDRSLELVADMLGDFPDIEGAQTVWMFCLAHMAHEGHAVCATVEQIAADAGYSVGRVQSALKALYRQAFLARLTRVVSPGSSRVLSQYFVAISVDMSRSSVPIPRSPARSPFKLKLVGGTAA